MDTPGPCRHLIVGDQQQNHSNCPPSPNWVVPFPMHVAALGDSTVMVQFVNNLKSRNPEASGDGMNESCRSGRGQKVRRAEDLCGTKILNRESWTHKVRRGRMRKGRKRHSLM